MENGSYLGILFIISVTYGSLIIFLFEKNKTLLELNQFLCISQQSLYNKATPLITIYLDVKDAKANAFATVGLYGFLSPSLVCSESR